MSDLRYAVVVPTVGRPSLQVLLDSLGSGEGPLPDQVVVVDDRRPVARRVRGREAPQGESSTEGLDVTVPARLTGRVRVLAGRARGPAAARNTGWRAALATGSPDWVAFLDDDVVPPPGWRSALAADLGNLSSRAGASQGGIDVPLPAGRPPTDWERCTAGLADAVWATADMAYRPDALLAVGGFDERFPRAYREDADLALRVLAAGWQVTRGARHVQHPVRPADRWVSVRTQAGNADDVLMRHLHSRTWRQAAQVPAGRRPRHLLVTASAVAGLAATLAGRPGAGRAAALGWLAGTAELAVARIAPGPRTRNEVLTMLATSVAIPPVATAWWLRGHAALLRRRARGDAGPWNPAPAAVLFDRDGTLVHDVPYNGDPDLVAPMPGAAEAVALLRRRGLKVGVVTNQSGIARGMITAEQVAAVNARVDALLGPFDVWAVCPHGEADRCACRKPAPGMVHAAARGLGIAPERCVVIGDIGADLEAARAAGAQGIMVPTAVTRPEEVAAASRVAPDLAGAVRTVLAAWT